MSFTQTGLGIRASINDSISRLHLDATGQAAGNDIVDSGGRFNSRNPDFEKQNGSADVVLEGFTEG
jgi:hypothetical protein